jgi:assimilatory nitrate reductase catalytic subunit
VDAEPVAAAQIHDSLAQRIGVRDGDLVRLRTRRGEAVMTARITADVRADTVFAPFHWGGTASANRLTNSVLDPHSRMPEFKVCAVAVDKHIPDTEIEGRTAHD